VYGMTDDREPADLAARYSVAGTADDLLQRWLEDPTAAEKWTRLAVDVATVRDEGD